jgi:hypothetical protein
LFAPPRAVPPPQRGLSRRPARGELIRPSNERQWNILHRYETGDIDRNGEPPAEEFVEKRGEEVLI